MTLAQIWLAAGIILLILEIITPGFVLANFGVAAIASAIAAWLGADLYWQVGVFIVVSLVSFFTVRPLLTRTMLNKGQPTPTGAAALIGRTTKVTEEIPGGLDTGRVKIDGDVWLAVSLSGAPIPQGALVRVARVESIKLYVEHAS